MGYTHKSIRTFEGHTAAVVAVDTCSVLGEGETSPIFVSASTDNTIKLWKESQSACISTCRVGSALDNITSLTCLKEGIHSNTIVVGAEMGGWAVFSSNKLAQGGELSPELPSNAVLSGDLHPTSAVCFSPDCSLLTTGGSGQTGELWDYGALMNDSVHGPCKLYSVDAASPINALCFSPTHYFLSAACNSCIKTWDLETKAVFAEFEPEFMSKVFTLHVSAGSESLCWSLTNLGGSELMASNAPLEASIAHAGERISEYLKCGGVTCFLESSEVSEDSPLQTYVGMELIVKEKSAYTSVRWTFDGNYLLAGSSDGRIHTFKRIDAWD